MSHFSVCVIVPDDGVVNNIHANNLEDHLIPVLAPFDEQTEEEKYREFEDRTEEAKADFENDTMRVVRFPDGSIHSIRCLHRNKMTVEEPCYSCIDLMDLSLHRPNVETEFASFTPATEVNHEE